MGEENCLPTVEESTEPPIRAHTSGNDHGPTTNLGLSPHNISSDVSPTSLTAPHTLSATQVAQALGVDIQYASSSFPLLLH